MTFSIIAKDTKTGNMGIGICTHWFGSGATMCWGRSGVGVVATQANTNKSFGARGLQLLESGLSPKEAIERLIREDKDGESRQLGILSANGTYDSFSGAKCIGHVLHYRGEGFSIQANLMANDTIADAIGHFYEFHTELDFEDRILGALFTGQSAGGDLRGIQSAGILIVSDTIKEEWEDKILHLRVDDAKDPLIELERLLDIHRAYKLVSEVIGQCDIRDIGFLRSSYEKAEYLIPGNEEIQFWKGITLIKGNQRKEGLLILQELFRSGEKWKELAKRMIECGLLANIEFRDLI